MLDMNHNAFASPFHGDTIIGHDVWIGSEAMILPGIQVGHGALLAARAVVTKDVAPYTVVGGNPAREIRKRFSDEEIELLLRIQWWDWDRQKVTQALPLLMAGDVRALARFSGT